MRLLLTCATPEYTGPAELMLEDAVTLREAGHDVSVAFDTRREGSLRERVPMSPRAIQQAPFRVLVGANMPAVLVEMGFISNPEQEKQLASESFQASIVQALVESLLRFRDTHGTQTPPPAAGARR